MTSGLYQGSFQSDMCTTLIRPTMPAEKSPAWLFSRQKQTILTRVWSGHFRTLTFKDVNKVFPTCVRGSGCQASPKHILTSLCL
ncbi:hypothetical protein TNCV_3227421 [Trichonephila clavipes]|nr:hypothetical protein TNCV_3227421 [Trichonephila clavipes]